MRLILKTSILTIAIVIAATTSVAAATTRVTFAGTATFASEVSPGVTTFDGTVMSVRGMVWVYDNAVGNPRVDGSDTVIINYDLDLVTGLGELWGTDHAAPRAYPDGGYDCHWHGAWAGGMPPTWSGQDVCHGSGTLEGWQLRFSIGSTPAIEGYLFHPGA